jgi:UDP:flavonoid glycosyltransferase YjiC (YdhE family)
VRVLFFAFSRSSLGHVSRVTAAAARFQRDGVTVQVAAHASLAGYVAAAGLPFRPIAELAPAPAWRGMNDDAVLREFVRTRQASADYVTRSLAEERAAIADFGPDAVVSDMRNTAGVAASMAGLPSVAIHNLGLFHHPMHVIVPEVLRTLAALGVEDRHAGRVLGTALAVPSLPPLEPLSGLAAPVRALVTGLVDEVRHVGPLFSPGTEEVLRQDRARSDPDGPGMLYVSLGGSGVGQDRLADVLAAVDDLRMRCVVVTGQADTAARDALERRLRSAVERSPVEVHELRTDAVRLMAGARCALMHGGHASTLEGLAAATPMVLLPHSREQRETAAHLAAAGLAQVIDEDSGPKEVRDAVVTAMERGQAARAHAAAALLGTDGAANLLALVREQVAWNRS